MDEDILLGFFLAALAIVVLWFVLFLIVRSITPHFECNIISFRNIDVKLKYHMLGRYVGSSNRELKKTRSTNIKQAVYELVKKTDGGEFLKNVTIYKVTKVIAPFKRVFYAAVGDALGTK